MSNKIFVGGLSWDTNDESLSAAFAPFGEIVEAKVILDRESGRSRGFGFVTMSQGDQAQAAITKMDGTTLDGRTIRVNEAQAKSRDGGRGGSRQDSGRSDRW